MRLRSSSPHAVASRRRPADFLEKPGGIGWQAPRADTVGCAVTVCAWSLSFFLTGRKPPVLAGRDPALHLRRTREASWGGDEAGFRPGRRHQPTPRRSRWRRACELRDGRRGGPPLELRQPRRVATCGGSRSTPRPSCWSIGWRRAPRPAGSAPTPARAPPGTPPPRWGRIACRCSARSLRLPHRSHARGDTAGPS
jgi:hypothetical protein